MAKHTLKILQCSHRKIFKVCLAILQHYVWRQDVSALTIRKFSSYLFMKSVKEEKLHCLFKNSNYFSIRILKTTKIKFFKFIFSWQDSE